jgi:hypothetical protein
VAEARTIDLGHSNIGDAVFLRLPLCAFQQNMPRLLLSANGKMQRTLPHLSTVDLSFCNLSASSAVMEVICGVLMNPAITPSLVGLNLVGNFRSQFGSPSFYCVGNNHPTGADAFVSTLTECWKSHPTVVSLALDPWLVAKHAGYCSIRMERLSTKRPQRAQRRQAVPISGDAASVSSIHRSQYRGSIVVQPTKFSKFDELVAAAEGSQVDIDHAQTVAELQYKLVQLLMSEHRSRERLVRTEVNDRHQLTKETSQVVQAVVQAVTRAQRHQRQRVAAMVDLEAEMRQMMAAKEEDVRCKVMSRFEAAMRR